MPVPTLISELSQTAGSNYPTGSESPITADNYLRTYASFIASLRDGKGFTNPVTLASAATCDIGGQNAIFVEITGTTGISSFGTNYYGPRYLRFQGALTLTYNATTLLLPGSASITTAAGDTCVVVPNQALNGWTVVSYQRASGASIYVPQIQQISASVGSNALTISASALALEFRSTTLGSGTVTFVQGTPANLVISSGSTLGTTSAVQSDIAVLALNNAGTIELAVTNLSGGVNLDETGLISTTAEGGAGAADSANVVYSTTARTNVAYRVIGVIRSTQATAGTWATAPSTIQGAGGQALSAMSSLGYGQTWQNVVGSRALATTYYNTTGKPIFVNAQPQATSNGTSQMTINGVVACQTVASANLGVQVSGIVPPGGSYSVNTSGTSPTLVSWQELR